MKYRYEPVKDKKRIILHHNILIYTTVKVVNENNG